MRRRGPILLLFVFLAACAPFSCCKTNPAGAPLQAREAGKVDKWDSVTKPFYAALPAECAPGEPVTVLFIPQEDSGLQDTRAVFYGADGKKGASAVFFKFIFDDEGHSVNAALIAPSTLSAPGDAEIKIENGGAVLAALPLKVTEREFVSETIKLNPSNTDIRTTPDPRKTEEAKYLWSIIGSTGSDIWTIAPFITPVAADTRRSSFFGDRRVYQYSNGKSDTSVHAGIDYAVVRGTQVHACADGKIMLARPRITTGNSIVLEHLPGLYSIYYHLDKINVEEGALVKAGELIGLSGSTGLSTGPHLHWEIRASTENVDPDVLVKRPLLDKDKMLKAIFGDL